MFYIYADDQLILNPLDKYHCVIQPRLTIEIGKAGGLEFSLPPNNVYYSRLRKLKTIITVFLDEAEIFRGRVLSEERNFANIKKVYCEGDLAFLVDSVQKNEKYVGTTHDFFRHIITRHNARMEADKRFAVGQIGIENRELLISGQSDDVEDAETGDFNYKQIAINASTSEWKTSYDYIQNCLIDYCGGYLRTRRVNGVAYIDLLTDFGHTAEQEIEFNKNLLDLTEEVTAEELFTVLIPLGEDNLTIASVNGGSDELVDETATALYGRILKTHVFDGVSNPNTLLENARRYLNSNVNIPITITLKAVDMHLVDPSIGELHVGDKVRVKSKVHNIVDYLTCTKIELDLENPGNNTYTFGNPKQSMTERYRKDIQKAEDAASGGGGGGGTGGAGAAAEASTSKANAWCTVLKEEAFASIGASNERIDGLKHTLQTECGIDFDGNTGNINIRSMYTKLSETGEQLVQQGAYIHLLEEEMEARIEMNVARVSDLEGVHKEHVATFTIFANDTESAIEAKADRFSVDAMKIELDALTTTTEGITEDIGEAIAGLSATYQRLDAAENAIKTNSASITTVSDQIGSRVAIMASSVDALGTRTASLEVKADNMESTIEAQADRINLKANTTTLNSNVATINAKIVDINANVTNLKTLVAEKVSASEINSYIANSTVSQTVMDFSKIVRTNSIIANSSITLAGVPVATKADLAGYASKGWVSDQGFATESYVSDKNAWGGSAETGKFWLKVGGANKIVALGNHTHSGYVSEARVKELIAEATIPWSKISGKPSSYYPSSHRHSISFSLANGHTHKVTINGKSYTTTGVSVNATHSYSGNTGYTGG